MAIQPYVRHIAARDSADCRCNECKEGTTILANIRNGDFVRLNYMGTLDDGTIFSTSNANDPLAITVGEGKLLKGLEDALIGMAEGERKEVQLSPPEGYGTHDPDKIYQVERATMPPELELKAGMLLHAEGEDAGSYPATVLKIQDDTVVLDTNHPLADQNLTFALEVVSVLSTSD